MAAPTVVSAAASTYATATSIAVALPPSLVAGNIILLFISTRQQNQASWTLTDPSNDRNPNWHQLLGLSSEQCVLFWKVVTGVEVSPVQVSWPTTAISVAFAVQISGASLTPVEVNISGVQQVNQAPTTSGTMTMTALTARKEDDLLLALWINAGSTNAITLPGSMTTILGDTAGNSRCINGAYEALSASGTTGTRVATFAGSNPNQVMAILLRSADVNGVSYNAVYNVRSYPGGPIDGYGASPAIAGYFDIGTPNSAYVGTYKVEGSTLAAGTLNPLYRKVLLLNDQCNRIVRTAMSVNADGSFVFNYLIPGEYVVVGVDQTGVDNFPIYAYVTAVPM